jgi:hypothetical protein
LWVRFLKWRDGKMKISNRTFSTIIAGMLFIMTTVITFLVMEMTNKFTTMTEKTVDNSVYSSKEIEIAIDSISSTELNLRIINKTHYKYSIRLSNLSINNEDTNITYTVELEPKCDKVETIDITNATTSTHIISDDLTLEGLKYLRFKAVKQTLGMKSRRTADIAIEIAQ